MNESSLIRKLTLIKYTRILEDYLEPLRIDVNELLKNIDHSQFKDEPYERNHLECVSTGYVMFPGGEAYWTAVVEKASPDAINLQCYLQDKLYDKWGSIMVNTEW